MSIDHWKVLQLNYSSSQRCKYQRSKRCVFFGTLHNVRTILTVTLACRRISPNDVKHYKSKVCVPHWCTGAIIVETDYLKSSHPFCVNS